MRDERPYPNELYEEWQHVIDQSDIPTHYADSVMQIVRYSQPPMTAYALQFSAEIYQKDHAENNMKNAVKSLISKGGLEAGKPKNTGTLHPVYYAMTSPRFLGRDSCQKAVMGRRLISEWFSEPATNVEMSRHNFYSHVLAVRHVLMAVIEAENAPYCTDIPPDKFFLNAIESDELYSQRRAIKPAYDTFIELHSGTLIPGERIRSSPSGGRRPGQSKRQDIDPWHHSVLETLVKASPPRQKVTAPAEKENASDPASIETDALGFRNASTPRAAEDADEIDENPAFQRSKPSTLTPCDDRRLIQRWSSGAATSSLPAMSDLSRLTPDQVRQVLAMPLPPLERTFIVLLLSTGLSVKRLLTLTVKHGYPASPLDCQDDRPYWYPDSGEMLYRLLDGPSTRTQHADMQWVSLHLPASLSCSLSDPEISISDRPFRGMRTSLNRRFIRHFRHHPGITPTLNRLSASSWLWRRPHAIDDVAAATLSGQFGLALAAPAAYRQLSRQEIQQTFDDTLQSLGLALGPAQVSSAEGIADLPVKGAVMGSAAAQPPAAFAALFTELREAMSVPAEALDNWWVGLPFPRESLASHYQYIAAYHLLAWQLSTGARPIGNSSRNRLGEHAQWIRDKASTRGTESRVVPLISEVGKALMQLQIWTQSLQHQLQPHGLMLDDQRSGLRDTPAWMLAPTRGQRLVMRDMMWSDLMSLPLQNIAGLANNVARHSLASWLRERIADAEVDALLGHARNGRSLGSPRATAAIGRQSALRKALSEWLRLSGFRQLKWERLPWNS